ncbi:unnamed protein product [Sphagnum troendelagicum]|uniref:Uncharacterized protein n=1 Tax=Sphagnum troendelagicum TaxID=128251 RepID=A0ABP0U529_9BRYO
MFLGDNITQNQWVGWIRPPHSNNCSSTLKVSATEKSVGDARAAVQPPVEDRLDDSKSVSSSELGDPVEQQTQLGTTNGVPRPTGSELDQIPPLRSR